MYPDRPSRPLRRSPALPSRALLTLVVATAVIACAIPAPAPTGIASVQPTDAPTPTEAGPSAAPSGAGAGAAATPQPSPIDGPLGGAWRVRKILAPEHRAAGLREATFDEEAWTLRPTCDAEPCPSLEVAITPLARSRPVTTATLDRDGATYRSPAAPGNDAPCLTPAGDPIPGGASTTRTLRLWLAESRPAGSSVTTVVLQGTLELHLTPTGIGRTGGCVETTARYDLTGRRGAVAVVDDGPTAPPPGDPADLVALPDIEVEVAGARIEYFDVEGSTALQLVESVAFGGVRACGEIDYEWHEGDARPAACAISRFPDFEDGIREGRDADGDCVITDVAIEGRYTIHMPRWVAPDRVPRALLAWWREVVEYIRVHEAEHVRISRDAVDALEADLDGEPCDEAGDIIAGWAADLRAAQAAFDRDEYAKPWPMPPAGV